MCGSSSRVIGPVPADCPEDGGKWAIYCEHGDAVTGEILYTGILQDSNKQRLRGWKRSTADWCPACQEIRDYGTLEFIFDQRNAARVRLDDRAWL